MWLDENNSQGLENSPKEDEVSLEWPNTALLCSSRWDKKDTEPGWVPERYQASCCGRADSTRTPRHQLPGEQPSCRRNPATEESGREEEPGMKRKIWWPKVKDSEAWQRLDNDLTLILKNSLKGKADCKVHIFSDIIYAKCLSRFGRAEKKECMPKAKSRREQEIRRTKQKSEQRV